MLDVSAAQNGPLILLLAGPSGAGKTTLLQQLHNGSLPKAVQDDLQHFQQATLVEITNELRRRIRAEGLDSVTSRLTRIGALIIHYDITSVYRFGLDSYEADPGLEFINLGRQLLIVSILPSQERLLQQFDSRAKMRLLQKNRLHRFWRTRVAPPLRRVRSAMTGLTLRSEHELYKSKDWVSTCYKTWQTFVSDIAARLPRVQAIYIEPYSDSANIYSFRKLPIREGNFSRYGEGVD